MSKISIRHTLQAAAGALLVALSLTLDFAKSNPKLAGLGAGVGFLLGLFSNAKVILLAKTLLDLAYPDAPAPVAPVTPVEQKKDGGFALPSRLAVLVIMAAITMFVTLLPKLVHAQTASQKYGGCLTPGSYGQICVGPRAGVLLTRYDVSGPLSGQFTGGFQPGAGYGVMLQSSDPNQSWRMVEFDIFGSAQIGGSSSTIPNNFALTGMFTFFNYITIGAGSQWTEQAVGSAKSGFFITGGLTLNPGGTTPAQAKANREAVRKELEQEAVQK